MKKKEGKTHDFHLNVISSAIPSLESEEMKTNSSAYSLFDISTIEKQDSSSAQEVCLPKAYFLTVLIRFQYKKQIKS